MVDEEAPAIKPEEDDHHNSNDVEETSQEGGGSIPEHGPDEVIEKKPGDDAATAGTGAVAEPLASTGNKDDCSDLTENQQESEEQAPKSFPQKLMDILTDDLHKDVIGWLPHGNGFIIHKKRTFAQDILPTFFKASKFTSFTRKLNRWGFSRVPRGPETGAYFHKLFRRDKPELCLQMTSNSGNKYQSTPLQQQLLPNVPGMMPPGAVPGMFPGHFPMQNPMMANLTPQQQQALWQQQMQMMQLQHMQMMHMQTQQQFQQQHQTQSPMGMPLPAQSQQQPQETKMEAAAVPNDPPLEEENQGLPADGDVGVAVNEAVV